MKRLAVVLIAACEFQPAPHVVPGKPVDAAVVAVAADAGSAATGDAAIAVTDDCRQTATHIAEVLIAGQKDESAKATFETARARIVVATAEVCTTQAWASDAQACYRQAKLEADLHACEKKFPPPKI
jgi:hypothetical protein